MDQQLARLRARRSAPLVDSERGITRALWCALSVIREARGEVPRAVSDPCEEVRVFSQATSKGAPEETRD